MVPADTVLTTAAERDADVVGLSGLITPSLDEMVHVAREMRRRRLDLPLLIGGATTSRKHTAVKIAPEYTGPVVHVADASRAVDVVGNLLSDASRASFVRRNREEQDRVREAHAGRAAVGLLPYSEAVARRPGPSWNGEPPAKPSFLGVRALPEFPLERIAEYIDWSPFFHAWELKGVFPKILEDARYGEAARELYEQGRRLLDEIVERRLLQANGVYGFFPAAADGDDVVVYAGDERVEERARLHFLRQQREKGADTAYRCLSDFVAPIGSGAPDYLGAFAVAAGFGLDDIVARFEREHDDYRAILAKALADRLAEAFAELLHQRARADLGFGAEENLTIEDLIKERYRGIRPAPGYPACPDHSEKRILFDLLDVENVAGIRLTESFAMAPAAAVCGYYFSHPEARYFTVGRIGRDQAEAYAERKGVALSEVERWLAPILES